MNSATLIFFRDSILFCHNVNLHCGASILYHNGGLHKIGGGLMYAKGMTTG